MPTYKTFNDLVISFIEYLRLTQPELDTKPGTVARDVFIDAPAFQLAELYSQLQTIAGLQSLLSTSGSDLTNLASNFGASRISGGTATGVVVFTTNNMDTNILIPSGSVVTSRNGLNFETVDNIVMLASSINVYRANASRLKTDLNLASITDSFAIEVNIQSLTAGSSGNIGRFSIISHNIAGISNVTNLSAFSGGSDAESDNEFRSRILSIFAGSNTGTSLGYSTAIEILPGVLDSIIVLPGDPLMTRDGTDTTVDANGNTVITNAGTGGKVDIYILGTDVESQVDSFIYTDESGNNDPTDPANDYIIGQSGANTTLNVAQRRVTLIAANTLPYQPVEGILSVAGSSSGSNFIQKYTDSVGDIKGNYELSKDTGDFGGSPFGFDKLHWISNSIELDNESRTKGIFNGSDALEFSDVNEIRTITQDYSVVNENSTKSNVDRSFLMLLHTPVKTTSRVVNYTTGERYIIEEQNPDGTEGELNTTGKIKISGSTLPTGTDILQVDYTWTKSFDNIFDFDNLHDYNATRTAQDSVDWSFGNLIINEPAIVSTDAYGIPTIEVTHSIFKVFGVSVISEELASVSGGSIIMSSTVTGITDIRRVSDSVELYNTDARDGSFSGVNIILPTDSLSEESDSVMVRYNAVNIYASDGYEGTFSSNIITLMESTAVDGTEVLVNYIANVSTLMSEQNLSTLPITKSGNNFVTSGVVFGDQPTSNILSGTRFTTNLRRAGTNLKVELKSIPSEGNISITGVSLKKVTDALVVVTAGSGYQVDLSTAILSDLGKISMPSTVKIIKLHSMERVNVSSGVVTSVDSSYDIVNYILRDNSYDLEVAIKNSTLNATSVIIPQTVNNISAQLETGDVIRVTFYYINTNDSEKLYFSRSGTHVTNKTFLDISKIYVSSGFKNTDGDLSGTISIKNYNQPVENTSYSVGYNYVAPKENERITITYNHNTLVNSATNSVETVRPITADVLIKMAITKDIDVSVNIVLLPEYIGQEDTVIQNATDTITSFLSANSLGTTIDQSDVINNLYSVSGIDRVRIMYFRLTDTTSNVQSISAENNEYLNAGTITVTVEER